MVFCCFRSSSVDRGSDTVQAPQELSENLLGSVKNFSHNELRKATNGFHAGNKIGRGGFGIVYKGVLSNGMPVAVKVLSAESKQGSKEFLTEINIIANVRHPNLVELIGCYNQGANRMLVYEYLENKSLDHALLGSKRTTNMEWRKRSEICIGTAKGLAYLHEELNPSIVHRDIKASNILLDQDFIPKIGDFGLAKLFPDTITHISTKVAGTTGYLAPEYVLGGKLTKKADVYSYGVLILEVISGRRNTNSNSIGLEKLLLQLAWELYQEERLLELVDKEMEEFPKDEVIRYMKVALFCTQAAAQRRPKMSQVVEMLSRKIRLNEKELTEPGFFYHSGESSQSRKNGKLFEEDSTSYQMSSAPFTITQVSPR